MLQIDKREALIFLGSQQMKPHFFGLLYPTHDSFSKTASFRAQWRVGDAVVGRKMFDERCQRVNISAYARTAHEKTGRGSLLNHP